MQTQKVNVTPAMAREWLKLNIDNRPIRQQRLEYLRNVIQCGEWRLTHQGIAFDKNRVLKDGQHRLIVISELPEDASLPLLVTTEMDTNTWGAIDRCGPRTPADEMKIDSRLTAAAQFLVGVFNNNQHFGVSLPYLSKFVEWAQPYHEELQTFCANQAKFWSSAPVRSAAIVQMARGHNADFVKTVYRSLVMSDFESMTPTAMALVKQQISGRIASARSVELFCRALRVFDSISPSVSRIQIGDVARITRDVREFLDTQIDAPKLKKADPRTGGSKGAKSGGNSTELKRVA